MKHFILMKKKKLEDPTSDIFLSALSILQPCFCVWVPAAIFCLHYCINLLLFSLPSVLPFPWVFHRVQPSPPAVKTLQDSLLPSGWSPDLSTWFTWLFFCMCLQPCCLPFLSFPLTFTLNFLWFFELASDLSPCCSLFLCFSGLLWFQFLGLDQMLLLLEILFF